MSDQTSASPPDRPKPGPPKPGPGLFRPRPGQRPVVAPPVKATPTRLPGSGHATPAEKGNPPATRPEPALTAPTRAHLGPTVRESRDFLTSPKNGTHPGQILYRGLGDFKAEGAAAHVQRVADIRPGHAYQAAFERFRTAMTRIGATTATLETGHPVAIGLGAASPIEVGITLHATYGVPFVPGTALKNVAKRAAATFEGDPEDLKHAIEQIFGTHGLAGGIEFWGGWVVPGERVLVPDVLTPHHGSYYSSAGEIPATDFDDPNPVPFLVIPPGCEVFFAVGSDLAPEWAELAWKFAGFGLLNLGVGAKGNVGYGIFTERADRTCP